MSRNTPQSAWVLPEALRGWERFWFTSADPTHLGLIRICTGLIVTYVLFAHSFRLQDFMGPNAWLDLKARQDYLHDRAMQPPPLLGNDTVSPATPTNEAERAYALEYRNKFGVEPPPPFPKGPEEAAYLYDYRAYWGFDLRAYGLRPPADDKEKAYLTDYTTKWKVPPPAYPATDAEAKEIDEYISRYRSDPRRVYARGVTAWSVWLHVTDPTAMAILHGAGVVLAVLFTVGFCTRITAALTWFTVLCYVHRNTQVQFGMDAMMVILMTYLVIGPSGAALSLDRRIARWWSRAKPAVVARWYRLLGRPVPADIAPAAYQDSPAPLVSANVAMRLLQIHVCIVYLVAGLAKLLGQAWWQGTAVWGTLANPEFAPFQLAIYDKALRWLAGTALPLYVFLNIGTLFTLCFEIGYAFLIWRPATRWAFLAGALILHGLIGLFMGLKTFALIMLVMNMAFLNRREVDWLLSWFTPAPTPAPATPARAPAPAPEPVGSGAGS